MASGSTGRATGAGSKGFDFGSDDILCSYEDYSNQDNNNGPQSDPSIAASAKEFNKNRMARASVYPTGSYSPPEESSFSQEVLSKVENTMKRHTDNIMRFLEGISSRLSQLELHCYNVDKSIGEMRTELVRDHGEAETKLKAMEKHVQEVHRSVQILRDKQELAETQKELAKLQLAQKESSSAGNSQQVEERVSTPSSDGKKNDNSSDVQGQQLAIVPHQPSPQPSIPAGPVEHQQPTVAPPSSMPSHNMPPAQTYYLPSSQMTNQPPQPQPSQVQYLPQSQIQDLSRTAPQPTQSQINQSPQVQSLPPYQQQWPQQLPQQSQPSQQPVQHPQIRPSSAPVYPSYLPGQPNSSPSEMASNNIPMQVPFQGASQQGASGPEAVSYGYAVAGRPVQPQASTQHLKPVYSAPSGDGYMHGGPRPTLSSGNAYMMFDGEGGRTHHAPTQVHFQQGSYPPTSIPPPNSQHIAGANMMVRPPQFIRGHPYNELIEKLVSMGFRGDHVAGIIQRMEEVGQPIDFNSVLDRLNGHSSGSSQRGWSG